MITSSPRSETNARSGLHRSEGTRLRGGRLVIARILWVTAVVFTLGVFIASLSAYFAQLQTICTGANCVFVYGQLTPGSAVALQHLGLSIGAYAASALAIVITSTVASFGAAGVLFWRKSDDWMAMLVSLFLVTFGINFSAQGILASNLNTAWNVPLTIVTALGWILLNFLLYLFPDGQFVPRWMNLVAVCAIAINLYWNIYSGAFLGFPSWVIGAILAGLGGSGLVSQIYRYVRVSDPVQRQQTKWVVFGLAALTLVILGRHIPPLIFPSLSSSNSFYILVSTYLYPLGLLLVPLTLGIAVLRYRLWDIDIIINRTLVYGTLTALLALLYFGLVVALQALFKVATGQVGDSPVAIVISTLAIAALFQPLRHRIQHIIDRRFYRRKYDAVRTLAAFSATLRHEVDLDQLREQLVAVVQETMQPASVSLWLRPSEQKRMPDARA